MEQIYFSKFYLNKYKKQCFSNWDRNERGVQLDVYIFNSTLKHLKLIWYYVNKAKNVNKAVPM